MPRKKPFSAKQRKAQLQDRRALKRGEIDELPPKPKQPRRAPNNPTSSEPSSRRLQSRFISVSPAYLALTRDLAHNVPLTRPSPPSSAEFPIEILLDRDVGRKLTCPSRPKFRMGQTKKEVERNEEGWFKKWLEGVEAVMRGWVESDSGKHGEVGTAEEEKEEAKEEEEEEEEVVWPRSPSWFETNLEVWRQLWRVTESSSIILLLLDSRCPPLHAPPSLRTYIQGLRPRKEVILVLTKADLVDPEALMQWKRWIAGWWGEDEVQVVSVMSYDLELLHAGKTRHKPAIPDGAMDELISALRTAHERLLSPPQRVVDDAERLRSWRLPVRRKVDWSVLARHKVPSSSAPPSIEPSVEVQNGASHEAEDGRRDPELEPLTIGLVGQPNVGKSSLLNALLGEQRVRASRTPGKTKHFQTMFWGWKHEVKVVDCPGLVCPSLVGLELQALAGSSYRYVQSLHRAYWLSVLPISQIPSLPACIHYSATLLPIETIFNVPKPLALQDDYADKRTWRDPARAEAAQAEKAKEAKWTAGGIMEARALDRGYLTAKGGRPDGNRAANFMMRALADGRVRWGFWPPGSGPNKEGVGIWLEGTGIEDERDGESEIGSIETDSEGRGALNIEEQEKEEDEEGEEDEDDEEAEDPEGEAQAKARNVGGFFAALDMASDEEGVSDEELEDQGK